MKEIFFNNIRNELGKIEIDCKSSGDSLELDDLLYFDLSEDILVGDNQIAVVLATLCGKVYDKVFMDLDVNRNVLDELTNFTNAEIQVNNVIEEDFVNNLSEDSLMLGFSGGLDSLAEYKLLTDCDIFDNIYLMSLDLQGRFSREEEFFKRFKPFTVKTNIIDLKLNRNHWSFMYMPQLLFSSFLGAKYVAVSAQFHAGPYGFNENFKWSKNDNIPVSFLGIERIPFTYGLTAISTARLTIHYTPELIDLSLKSLANPGEEKRYRKQMLVDILSKKYDKRVYVEYVKEGSKHNWGNKLGVDFITLYLVKNAGIEEASKIMNNIPEESVEFLDSMSLDFYEKYNINFLDSIPEKFRTKFLQKLIESGILPYNSGDFKEFFKVAEFLAEYYPNLKRVLDRNK